MNGPSEPTPLSNSQLNSKFQWNCQPAADAMLRQFVDDFCDDCEFARELRSNMLDQTGTRLIDVIDHIALPDTAMLNDQPLAQPLLESGYTEAPLLASKSISETEGNTDRVYLHDGGLFPPICLTKQNTNSQSRRLVIRVEAVDDFLAAHKIFDRVIEGLPLSSFRRCLIAAENDCEFWILEKKGRGFEPAARWTEAELFSNEPTATQSQSGDAVLRCAAAEHFEAFKLRQRNFLHEAAGFQHARELIEAAIQDLGIDWTCELFFAAERDYWQRRNRAARIQKVRQDRLGFGWANHDHHTYRSSRASFAGLISVLEQLGFHCRERFYAGEKAGWGAQVLEQSPCGIVIFADVDMSPTELAGDFSHDGLEEKSELGTVGLWCQLHGEAFLQAGMHHLECTFDFDAAREQLAAAGVESMAPFTDFGYLRQAFTTGEIWSVDRQRVESALQKNFITREQADQFLAHGSIGSHLEILERNEGFKGFNQTGVSDIIQKTDPRRQNL